MRTQREFISATIDQLLEPENIFNINKILNVVFENVKTNLDFNTIKDYLPYVVGFDINNLSTDMLPGESVYCNKAWLYKHDEEKTKQVVNNLFVDINNQIEDTDKES